VECSFSLFFYEYQLEIRLVVQKHYTVLPKEVWEMDNSFELWRQPFSPVSSVISLFAFSMIHFSLFDMSSDPVVSSFSISLLSGIFWISKSLPWWKMRQAVLMVTVWRCFSMEMFKKYKFLFCPCTRPALLFAFRLQKIRAKPPRSIAVWDTKSSIVGRKYVSVTRHSNRPQKSEIDYKNFSISFTIYLHSLFHHFLCQKW